MSSQTDLQGIQKIRSAALAVLLAIAAHPAFGREESPLAAPESLAAEVMRKLEKSPKYRELQALYETHRRQNGDAWMMQSARGRRMWAMLEHLRTTAATVQVELIQGRPTVSVTIYGRKRVLVNMPISTDQHTIDYAAGQIADLILRDLHDKGRLPIDRPGVTQQAVDEKMQQGYDAAKRKDYLSAIRHFDAARAGAQRMGSVLQLGPGRIKSPRT